jgi:hypothetical protein
MLPAHLLHLRVPRLAHPGVHPRRLARVVYNGRVTDCRRNPYAPRFINATTGDAMGESYCHLNRAYLFPLSRILAALRKSPPFTPIYALVGFGTNA